MELYYKSNQCNYLAEIVQTGNVVMVSAKTEYSPDSVIPAAASLAYSFAGVPVIVGLKDDILLCVPMEDLKGVSATKETFQLLKMFKVQKDEEIRRLL